ncbi:FecR family protein [Dyadobacter luticola]|uniref:DUF4974 domain-containing protein n=1 Tax=Dyadobacter luticola TaxID=1979387 RepID=A0A5R9KSL2_9BACT|nr:FecR domain-containing protein [Dyadobacter luticola]TLU99119.1 DUF4974 domain-containing protein [Dyadobacter luticola]
MKFHENISEELLARYLAETASPDERVLVENWLEQSLENRQEFAAYRLIWDHSATISKKFEVNTDAAWGKMKMKMDQTASAKIEGESRQIDFIPASKQKFPWKMWAAAVVTLTLLVLGWLKIQSGQHSEPLQIATTNNTTEKILPDGTKVFLNYNSSLTYPKEFNGDFRTVSLKGEAFFEVKRDTGHPFIIQANGTEVKVLGTSFNVKAYEKSPVRVDVATGKVQVSKASRKIELVKGEGAEVGNDTILGLHANMNMLGYKTQVYDFQATTLNDVITSIREGYHVDVRLSNQQIARCRLTIRFEKQPLDATLAVIAETLDLDLKKEGQVYWLDGNSCQ